MKDQWQVTPTDTSRANLRTGRIAAYGFSRKVGSGQRLRRAARQKRLKTCEVVRRGFDLASS